MSLITLHSYLLTCPTCSCFIMQNITL